MGERAVSIGVFPHDKIVWLTLGALKRFVRAYVPIDTAVEETAVKQSLVEKMEALDRTTKATAEAEANARFQADARAAKEAEQAKAAAKGAAAATV